MMLLLQKGFLNFFIVVVMLLVGLFGNLASSQKPLRPPASGAITEYPIPQRPGYAPSGGWIYPKPIIHAPSDQS